LATQDGEDHPKSMLKALETLMELVMKNIELLCTLRN
jgi:hypothetical protein